MALLSMKFQVMTLLNISGENGKLQIGAPSCLHPKSINPPTHVPHFLLHSLHHRGNVFLPWKHPLSVHLLWISSTCLKTWSVLSFLSIGLFPSAYSSNLRKPFLHTTPSASWSLHSKFSLSRANIFRESSSMLYLPFSHSNTTSALTISVVLPRPPCCGIQ